MSNKTIQDILQKRKHKNIYGQKNPSSGNNNSYEKEIKNDNNNTDDNNINNNIKINDNEIENHKKDDNNDYYQQQIAKLENDNKQLKEVILREKAENENLRRRYEREISNAESYGITKFARDIVEILENLHRAKSHIKISEENKSIIEGFEMNIKIFEESITKHGIKRVSPLGEQFDPKYHQAVAHINGTGEQGSIADVIQAGYILNDRILKPALVAVIKKDIV
ncbi:nucleotide exchange factor GrpE [Lyticum sinuosum]|uniref:Protein GrpE n=1 Tax=Lyticum sinuosum TaxID=1332059 RepID=A0AAE4VL11_9RICK|nr:nucleotide exchange factor GrpE [Lyticum sinuosum]MDZ5761032.1 Protein GrpE [Lyticum sinuosum]